MKAKKEIIKYLHRYVAVPLKKDIEFAHLNQIQLTTSISIYSNKPNNYKINKILKSRSFWPYDNQLKYLKYKFVNTSLISGELIKIRKSDNWKIELNSTPLIVEETNQRVYNCFTTLNHLKYLQKKYSIKAWIFSRKGIWNKTLLLKNATNYKHLINKGKVLVLDPYEATKCLRLRESLGHTVDFIYDIHLIPKLETKSIKIRKHKYNALAIEQENYNQRMVCITDGISVHRLKKNKAIKIITRFPLKVWFCEKYIYHQYLKKLDESKVKHLSTQGDKTNLKNTKTRKDRRSILQKRKLYSRHYKSQFIEMWVPDKDGEYETFAGNKTIIRYHKPKKDIRQIIKRKTKLPSMFEKVEKEFKGIKINKFPYNKPITVIYTHTDKDGIEHHKKEQNVKMLNKKIIRENSETKEQIVLCSVKDVEKWVHQEDYSIEETVNIEWIPYVEVITFTRTKMVKVPFHLPKKQKKIKQWKTPIEEDVNVYAHHCDIIRRKIRNNKQKEIKPYITNLLNLFTPKHREGFALWIKDDEPHLHDIIQNAMLCYIDEKYINTPMRDFLIDIELPF